MRVLVTGHKGYIGSGLVSVLRARGHDVSGTDPDFFSGCSFTETPVDIPNLGKDVRDIERADLERFEAVLHLGGLSNDPLGDFHPRLTYRINQDAAVSLALNAREAGVERFVFASSCSVYGESGDNYLYEESAKQPVTPYAWSKLNAESSIKAMAGDHFFPVSLRAGTVYGVSPRIRFDLVVNNLAAWAMATGVVRLKSDGSAWRPVVHVADVCEAYAAVLEAPVELVRGEVFNVGRTEQNFRVRDLALKVQEGIPGTRLEQINRPVVDQRNYRVNCDKICRVLDSYRPSRVVEDGVAELRSSLGEHAVAVEDFEGSRYNRLPHLAHLIETGALGADLRWIRGPGE
jgi:nucleoside-diphosphate-sugar epimerase